MACSQPGKRLSNAVTDCDIISGLPLEIKEKILMKMPIKEAVKTSILSTKWRYTWASMPELVLRDDELVPDMGGPEAISLLVRIVDLVLFLHKGEILKFELSTKHLCTEAFDRWILNLSQNGLTRVSFLLNLKTKYNMPSNFFFCSTMRKIYLSGCFIELPQNFEGFKFLTTLNLEECTISAADIERLVSSSPVLQSLILWMIHVEDDLRIRASKLTYLGVNGTFLDLQIDAPHLISAYIKFSNYKSSTARVGCLNKLWRSLCGLRTVRDIGLFGFSMLYLVDKSTVELLKALTYVKRAFLEVDFANNKETSFLFSLLQNAHNLQAITLAVKMSGNTTTSIFGEKDIVFKHLKTVIVYIWTANSEPVLAFSKFILSSAPVLRKLTLKNTEKVLKETNPEVFKQLLKFRRASPDAQVIFE